MTVLKNGEILLYGIVGDGFFDDGFTALDVVDALAEIGRSKDVTVRINSGGGIAREGIAIFNALNSHRGEVKVIVDSVAASAASLMAMGGDEIIMRTGAMMMIHDPAMITIGNAEQHKKALAGLETASASMAEIYAERTERPIEEIRDDMAEETWLTADEAVESGYADKKQGGRFSRTSGPTAFDYRLYQHAPEKMVALAESRAWEMRAEELAGIAADPGQQKDDSIMTKSTTAEQQTAQDEAIAEAVATATKDAVARAEAAEAAVAKMTEEQTVEAGAQARADAAEIASICAAGGVSAMAAPLIRDGVSPKDAQARVDGAKEISAAVESANRDCPSVPKTLADEYLAAGRTIVEVRADLFDRMAKIGDGTTQDNVSAHHAPAGPNEKVATINTAEIYDKINRRAAAA